MSSNLFIDAHMVYARTTEKLPVSLQFSDNWQNDKMVAVTIGKSRQSFRVTAITPPEGQVARILTLDNGNKVIIEASILPGFIDEKSWSARLDKAEQASMPLIISLGLVAVIAVGALIYWSLPKLADKIADYIPQPVIDELSEQTLSQLDSLFLEDSGLSSERQLDLINKFNELQGISGNSHKVELLFRASPILGANALALPGGPIILLDELVALAPSDDGIYGVLAHELAHISLAHNRKHLSRDGLFSILSYMIGNGQDLGGATKLFKTLAFSSYSRDFEEEADQLARQWMDKAGYDLAAFDEMLIALYQQRCDEACPDNQTQKAAGWFDSHPSLSERLSVK